MKKIFKEILGANSFGEILGKILALLSVFVLIKQVFNYGFSTFFLTLVEYYNKLVIAMLGWAEPFLTSFILYLNKLFLIQLELHPHWRHVFILLNIYFLRTVYINYKYGYKKTGIFSGFLCIIISFSASLILGVISIEEKDSVLLFKYLLVPILSIFIYDISRQLWIATFSRKIIADKYGETPKSWWGFFQPNFALSIFQAVISIFLVILFLQLDYVCKSQSPLLFSLGLLVFSLAIYRIILALIEAPRLRNSSDSYYTSFLRTNSAGVGLSVISLYFWIIVFLVTNAGLQFIGL